VNQCGRPATPSEVQRNKEIKDIANGSMPDRKKNQNRIIFSPVYTIQKITSQKKWGQGSAPQKGGRQKYTCRTGEDESKLKWGNKKRFDVDRWGKGLSQTLINGKKETPTGKGDAES